MEGENEGEGEAEVVLSHGVALVGGVGLEVAVEGVADLNVGGPREGVVGEGVLGGEEVEGVA